MYILFFYVGIKLRKVEKNEQKEVERVNALHDVASILARRVAVEFSDSDSASESEYDSEGWGEQETSAWHQRTNSGHTHHTDEQSQEAECE